MGCINPKKGMWEEDFKVELGEKGSGAPLSGNGRKFTKRETILRPVCCRGSPPYHQKRGTKVGSSKKHPPPIRGELRRGEIVISAWKGSCRGSHKERPREKNQGINQSPSPTGNRGAPIGFEAPGDRRARIVAVELVSKEEETASCQAASLGILEGRIERSPFGDALILGVPATKGGEQRREGRTSTKKGGTDGIIRNGGRPLNAEKRTW